MSRNAHQTRIAQTNTIDIYRRPPDNGWQDRHNKAFRSHPLAHIVVSCAQYADAHRARFDSGIGEDYVLGPEWIAILKGVRGLLNGETGQLDCGTVDGMICDMLRAEGVPESDL